MNAVTKRKRVQFHVRGSAGQTIFVSGTFNDWQASKTKLKWDEQTRNYKISVLVPPGRHEYRFVIDGEWCMDPDCQEWVPNPFGTLNSVLTVQ